jgi:hypothetical protein
MMKTQDLIKLLERYPDFQVKTTLKIADGTAWGFALYSADCKGIEDVGHSDKTISLEFDFTEIEGCYAKFESADRQPTF